MGGEQMRMQAGLDIVPDQGSLDGLGVDPGVVASLERLILYSERLPVIRGWPPEELTHPLDRHGLLYRLREESLVHPLLMYKDACQREPYLIGNNDLIQWILNNVQGSMTPRYGDENCNNTRRCSACGCSFFGFPLANHSVKNCGFVRFIEPRFRLQFFVANHHSFCGHCNARSAHHSRCDEIKPCIRCGEDLGHQEYHGVCDTEYGASPQAFQQRVREIRIERGERIRYLISRGFLAIPLPTDYVPRAILAYTDRLEQQRLVIRGCGPLLRPEANRFSKIPDQVYRWKRYRGLVNVELEVQDLLPPVVMHQDEIEEFRHIEIEARILSIQRQNDNISSFILDHVLHIDQPRFPHHIVAPGGLLLEPELPPRLLVQPRGFIANGNQILEDIENRAESPRSQNSSNADWFERDVPIPEQRVIEDFDNMLRLNPVVVDPQVLVLTGVDRQRHQSLADRVQNLQEELGDPNQIAYDARGVGILTVLQFENNLRQLILKELEPWHVRLDGNIYSIKVSRSVVACLRDLEVPRNLQALATRIENWQILLSGSCDSLEGWYEDIAIEHLEAYHQYLMGLADALSMHECCLTRLASQLVGPITSGPNKGILTIREYQIPRYRHQINMLAAHPQEGFAAFNMPRQDYPLNVASRRNEPHMIREDEEKQFERDLKAIVRHHDNPRIIYDYRVSFPSTTSLDCLLASRLPCHKPAVISRIILLQNLMSGSPEHRQDLMRAETASLICYIELWNVILPPIRCLVQANKTAPFRLTDCRLDIVHGCIASIDSIFPTYRLYTTLDHAWWIVWASQFFIPALKKVNERACTCHSHGVQVHHEQREGDDNHHQ